MSVVKEHFENIANDYDYWKKKNWYYYKNIINIIKEYVPSGKRVLEIGCGTGDILASVKPKYGIGTDLSSEMIRISKSKYTFNENLRFYLPDEVTEQVYDFVLLIDLIEHLENREDFFRNIHNYCDKNTNIILLMANPNWEPLLLLLEKLKLKMPEGPHFRINYADLKKELVCSNFKIVNHHYRQLLPCNLNLLSEFINDKFYRIPVIRKLGLTEIIVIKSENKL